MGYLFLSIALFSGAVKGFSGKKISGYAANTKSAVLLNMIRMLLCVVFSFFVILITRDIASFTLAPKVLLISAVSGISTAFFVVSWLLAVRKSAYMMLDVFLMLGTLVPIISGYFLFSEPISLRQWLGFALLIVAVLIMCSYNNTIKVKLSASSLLLLIACGISSGITSISQKAFVRIFADVPISLFNLYTYVFAGITLAVFFLIPSKNEKVRFDGKGSRTPLIYVSVMAAALTANSYFATTAALYLDSARLYPLNQGAALILSTLMATFFFKEKLTVKAAVGIALSFIALMIINL